MAGIYTRTSRKSSDRRFSFCVSFDEEIRIRTADNSFRLDFKNGPKFDHYSLRLALHDDRNFKLQKRAKVFDRIEMNSCTFEKKKIATFGDDDEDTYGRFENRANYFKI